MNVCCHRRQAAIAVGQSHCHSVIAHVYNLAARMRSPDLRWTMGRMTLKCIYTFAVTFSKMEKLVKFLILQ